MTTTATAHSSLTRCKHCDGSRMVKLLPGRAHGTGRLGCVDTTIAGQEDLTPERHCSCVRGPLWSRLQTTPFGRASRLDQIGAVEYQKGRVVFFAPENGDEAASWFEMPAREWRAMLRKIWPQIIAGETLEEITAKAEQPI